MGGIVSGTACGQSSGATVARSETYDYLINIIDLDVRLALAPRTGTGSRDQAECEWR
jgi:hypothetical protein